MFTRTQGVKCELLCHRDNAIIMHWSIKALDVAWSIMFRVFTKDGVLWFHWEHPRELAKLSYLGPW